MSIAASAIAFLLGTPATSLLPEVFSRNYDANSSGGSAIPILGEGEQMKVSMIADQSPSRTRSDVLSTPIQKATTDKIGTPSVMSLKGDFSTQAALQIPRTFQFTDIVSSTGYTIKNRLGLFCMARISVVTTFKLDSNSWKFDAEVIEIDGRPKILQRFTILHLLNLF